MQDHIAAAVQAQDQEGQGRPELRHPRAAEEQRRKRQEGGGREGAAQRQSPPRQQREQGRRGGGQEPQRGLQDDLQVEDV